MFTIVPGGSLIVSLHIKCHAVAADISPACSKGQRIRRVSVVPQTINIMGSVTPPPDVFNFSLLYVLLYLPRPPPHVPYVSSVCPAPKAAEPVLGQRPKDEFPAGDCAPRTLRFGASRRRRRTRKHGVGHAGRRCSSSSSSSSDVKQCPSLIVERLLACADSKRILQGEPMMPPDILQRCCACDFRGKQ